MGNSLLKIDRGNFLGCEDNIRQNNLTTCGRSKHGRNRQLSFRQVIPYLKLCIPARLEAPVGSHDFLRRRFPVGSIDEPERKGRVQIVGEYVNILSKVEFDAVEEIAEKIIKRYCREDIDGVYLVFNEFKSVISQRVIVQRILPVQDIGRRVVTQADEFSKEERERMAQAAKTAGVSLQAPETSAIDRKAVEFAAAPVDYIYEQPAGELLNGLLPRYVAVQLYQSLLESVAAEHAARMTAMDSATNNANDVIDSLTLTLNRVRQAAITKEIIEIVSGAAAL